MDVEKLGEHAVPRSIALSRNSWIKFERMHPVIHVMGFDDLIL